MKKKLLCICDSPTLQSGFARVAQNLISRWVAAGVFDDVWCWGIGYAGYPHSHDYLHNRIIPSGTFDSPHWHSDANRDRLLKLLQSPSVGDPDGGFTHVWMMQDTFLLEPMADKIKEIGEKMGFKSFLYFPVDAPLDIQWTRIIDSVDVPVAYTEYALEEAKKLLLEPLQDKWLFKQRFNQVRKLLSLPHGVDTSVYHPLKGDENQVKLKNSRKQMFGGAVGPDDFLMVNVSQNQKRKGMIQSMTLLKHLLENYPSVPAKLYLHCASVHPGEGTDLKMVAEQIGLRLGKDLFIGDVFFRGNHPNQSEGYLNGIYNMADLVLSTSYGEGWGLPITEAMAAGRPVAGPCHTSIRELMADDRGLLFPLNGFDIMPQDMSRVRPRIDVEQAAWQIATAYGKPAGDEESLQYYANRGYEWATSDFLSWDRIAKEWIKLFEVE